MKDVGEPCAGEPHARFEAAAGGARRPVGQPVRKPQPPADPSMNSNVKGAVAEQAIVLAAIKAGVPVLRRSPSMAVPISRSTSMAIF